MSSERGGEAAGTTALGRAQDLLPTLSAQGALGFLPAHGSWNSTLPGGSEIGISSSSHFIGLVGPTPGVSQRHRGEPKNAGRVARWSRGMVLA